MEYEKERIKFEFGCVEEGPEQYRSLMRLEIAGVETLVFISCSTFKNEKTARGISNILYSAFSGVDKMTPLM